MKTILVTGADGLLGSNLVRELISRQYNVRALLQPARNTATLNGLNIDARPGDLLNASSVLQAAKGCDAIVHAAALTTVWPSRSALIRAVNVTGTQNVLDAAEASNVRRLIYVGSASSFGFGTKANPGSEGSAFVSHKYGLDYIDSKREAQDLVLAAAHRGLPCLVVNPTFMFGGFDGLLGPSAMIRALVHRQLPGYSTGGRNFVCVRDVAHGIANALTMGRAGECYILGNENLTYKEVFAKVAQVTGTRAPRLPVNSMAMQLFGWLSERIAQTTGGKPTVSLAMARISCEGQYYSAAKAVRELVLPQTPIEYGIAESFAWLQTIGAIRQEKLMELKPSRMLRDWLDSRAERSIDHPVQATVRVNR